MTVSEKGCLRYEDNVLDEDSWRIVRKELKETEENKKKCLDILKAKILGKPPFSFPVFHIAKNIFLYRKSKHLLTKLKRKVPKFSSFDVFF